ncbi:MAG: hypothetical protein IPH18_11475 [Chitinophagaceae bacterium]|nr:hypothetical protein [Chitinophagaceae bacterium]
MKKLLILCMVFVTVVYTSGQTPIIITPGEGIGNLKLGMNEKETMAILSGTVTWGSYK